jgi:hypothetical protein
VLVGALGSEYSWRTLWFRICRLTKCRDDAARRVERYLELRVQGTGQQVFRKGSSTRSSYFILQPFLSCVAVFI